MKRYLISEERLLLLIERDIENDLLEGGGVDDWEGYPDCFYDEERKEFQLELLAKERLEKMVIYSEDVEEENRELICYSCIGGAPILQFDKYIIDIDSSGMIHVSTTSNPFEPIKAEPISYCPKCGARLGGDTKWKNT